VTGFIRQEGDDKYVRATDVTIVRDLKSTIDSSTLCRTTNGESRFPFHSVQHIVLLPRGNVAWVETTTKDGAVVTISEYSCRVCDATNKGNGELTV
jgi:hypothetical protein